MFEATGKKRQKFFHNLFIAGFLRISMSTANILKEEHAKLRSGLLEIESFIQKKEIDAEALEKKLNQLCNFWNEHEKREEEYFQLLSTKNKPFPTTPSLMEQHRELRGHWTVLRKAVSSKKADKIRVALDTDGRMLVQKLREHMDLEDSFL